MRCYKLFLPEFEWGSITPVASGSVDSRLLKCTIVTIVIIQVQCNPWCFPRHNCKGILCPVRFIHASCCREGWWHMKQPVEGWNGDCPQTSPALCQRSLPPGQGHLCSTQSHCRTAAACLSVLGQFRFGTGLLLFELQTVVIPGTTLLLAQRSLHEGQPLAGEQQGRARQWELLQPSDFHLLLWLNTLPDHKGQLFVSKVYRRWSLDITQIWWVWALQSNLSSWIIATHQPLNLLNSIPEKLSVFQECLG